MKSEDSILKDMGDYKEELIAACLNSDEICELMFNKNAYSEEDAEHLVYTQIFPTLYVEETQDVRHSYLCVETEEYNISNNSTKDMRIIVWAYCHKDIMKYSKEGYSGTRADILADMFERLFRKSDKFGIGKLELKSVSHININNKYYGKALVYRTPDFRVSK